jgi:hypothetical protein
VSRTVGGSATPAALRARLAAGRGAERTTKCLPSCSISVSVSGNDLGPGAGASERCDAVLQRLLQHQREKAAEHVAADGFVELVEDWPGREQVLGGAEGLLHRPQLLVAEHGFERVEIGVGPQHEDAVELLLLLDLVGINREVLIADRLQVAPKAGVADQRLVAFGQLPLQRGEDCGAIYFLSINGMPNYQSLIAFLFLESLLSLLPRSRF